METREHQIFRTTEEEEECDKPTEKRYREDPRIPENVPPGHLSSPGEGHRAGWPAVVLNLGPERGPAGRTGGLLPSRSPGSTKGEANAVAGAGEAAASHGERHGPRPVLPPSTAGGTGRGDAAPQTRAGGEEEEEGAGRAPPGCPPGPLLQRASRPGGSPSLPREGLFRRRGRGGKG